MSIIIRDGTNAAQLATVDVDGNLHVLAEIAGGVSITEGTPSPVDVELGSASTYALLAAAGITNTGSTVVNGGVIGSYPTATETGFPPGIATIDNADAAAALAAALTAYNFYTALTFTPLASDDVSTSGLSGGSTYNAGNYSGGALDIPTTITLDAQGNPGAIFVFKAASTLTLHSGASVLLINGALANNVIWIVGSSATTVATSTMTGTILANTSITLGGGTLNGRALAGVVTSSGAVTIAAATQINVPASLLTPLSVSVANFPILQQVAFPIAVTGSVPAATTVTSTSSAILAANTARKECRVENTSTVAVYLGLGRVPTATAYHVALKACAVANDGTGGVYDSTVWKGAINAIVASTSGTVVVTELT
jgi:Ice-binding-like